MGVVLTPIVVKEPVTLAHLRGKVLAVDAPGELYQFLALIRLRDGTPLRDSSGRITSHLAGLFYRTTRLIAEHGLKLAFVFDGTPPAMKSAEIARRRSVKRRYDEEHAQALQQGDLARAYSKATMTSRLTREMAAEAGELVRLLGLPAVQAPSEAEAQAAHMAKRPGVWAAASKDYDALLFGAPRLARFLTTTGREFLPSRNEFRPIVPELIDLGRMLDALGITHDQLVDLAILVGTDFNPGIKGIGPKKALKLVQQHGSIDTMPAEIRDRLGEVSEVRRIYRTPAVTDDYDLRFQEPDIAGVMQFMCAEREFSHERIAAALERAFRQPTLW